MEALFQVFYCIAIVRNIFTHLSVYVCAVHISETENGFQKYTSTLYTVSASGNVIIHDFFQAIEHFDTNSSSYFACICLFTKLLSWLHFEVYSHKKDLKLIKIFTR